MTDRSRISIRRTKTIFFKNVVDAYRIESMQFSNNKTKRTRKSTEKSVAAPLEGPATRAEESANPRQKRMMEKVAESASSITNHRKATKKTGQAVSRTEPVAAGQSAATAVLTPRQQSQGRVVTHEDIALLAYSYWEERGYQGGSPVEDWLRAEYVLRLS